MLRFSLGITFNNMLTIPINEVCCDYLGIVFIFSLEAYFICWLRSIMVTHATNPTTDLIVSIWLSKYVQKAASKEKADMTVD